MIISITSILIIGSACCILIGGIAIAIRAVKLANKERALANKIWVQWRVRKADSHTNEEDAAASSESDEQYL